VRLKIGLENDNNGHNFTFTSPLPVALTERETFKAQLSTIISNNRAAREAVPHSPQKSINVLAASPSPNGAANRPSAPMPSRPSTSRAESVSSTRGTPVNDPVNDFRIRKKVLVKTPELAALHRELVMSGQITETEFWEGREVRSTRLGPNRAMSDVMSTSSISFLHKTLSTLRRRVDQVNWLIQDRRRWKAARSRLLLHHN